MMLPQQINVLNDKTRYPTLTYKVNWDTKHISDYVDGKDAVMQAVDLHLSTERYLWEIYSWQYGSELTELIGKPMDYVVVEAPRMIRDALSVDNRIRAVSNFRIQSNGRSIHCKFTVITTEGENESEIDINA